MQFEVLYLVWAAVVEAEVADGCHLGIQHLLLSLQLLLHLPSLGEGLGHRLVVVQVGCRRQRRQQVCWGAKTARDGDTRTQTHTHAEDNQLMWIIISEWICRWDSCWASSSPLFPLQEKHWIAFCFNSWARTGKLICLERVLVYF